MNLMSGNTRGRIQSIDAQNVKNLAITIEVAKVQ